MIGRHERSLAHKQGDSLAVHRFRMGIGNVERTMRVPMGLVPLLHAACAPPTAAAHVSESAAEVVLFVTLRTKWDQDWQ